jgi:hypothetical protein
MILIELTKENIEHWGVEIVGNAPIQSYLNEIDRVMYHVAMGAIYDKLRDMARDESDYKYLEMKDGIK